MGAGVVCMHTCDGCWPARAIFDSTRWWAAVTYGTYWFHIGSTSDALPPQAAVHSVKQTSPADKVPLLDVHAPLLPVCCCQSCRRIGLSESELNSCFTTDPCETPIHVLRWGVLGDTWPYFRPNYTNMEQAIEQTGAQEVNTAGVQATNPPVCSVACVRCECSCCSPCE